MKSLSPLLLLYLLQATTARKHKKAKQHKHRAKKLEHQKKIDQSLIHTKSLSWKWYPTWSEHGVIRAFGPKHKGQLCDTLTSSVVLFDVDNSGGLDWTEFQVFNTAIVDVVRDHVSKAPPQPTSRKLQANEVYHDMTCECHYTFGKPQNCCHDEKEESPDGTAESNQIQVTFQGLNTKGDDRTDEEKVYRRHFCDGIMYLLESEGIDLINANDAIVAGLNVDTVDFDMVDGTSVAATVTTTPVTVGAVEGLPGSDAISSTIDSTEEADEKDEEKSNTAATTAAVQSTQSATTTSIGSYETSKQVDASTSSMMSASTTEEDNTNSSIATSATIGILFAVLAAILATVLTIIHRKREEKRRLAEFAGDELVDEDLEANSVHNDVVAIDMGDGKAYAELSPEAVETKAEDSGEADINDDDNSDVMSVVSLEQNECAQISFEEVKEGEVEAMVTVGSTLAAMGVASTVTSKLSTQNQQESTPDV